MFLQVNVQAITFLIVNMVQGTGCGWEGGLKQNM